MMPQGNTADALASLRAASESRQMYNEALLSRLAGQQQQQASFLPQEFLGLQQHSRSGNNQGMGPSAHDILLLAARNAQAGGLMNPALFGASNSSANGTTSALTRHYLQLLQSRQDSMTNAMIGGGMSGNNVSKSSGTGGDGDSGSNEDR